MKKDIIKRCKLLRLSVVVVLALVAGAACAATPYDFSVGDLCYNIVSSKDSTCEVTYKYEEVYNNMFNYGKGDVVIPETVTRSNGETYTVVGIGSSTFYRCLYLTSVSLPQTLKYIGDTAFNSCTALKKITLPDGLETIGDDTFYNCELFKEVTVPNSVTSIGYEAFGNCPNLKTVTIGEGVTYMGPYTFYGCELTVLYLFGRLDTYYAHSSGFGTGYVFAHMTCETLYAHLDQIEAIEENYSGTVLPIEQLYPMSINGIYPRSIEYDMVIADGVTISSLQLNEQEVVIDGDGPYIAKDLLPNTEYTFTLSFMFGEEERTQETEVTTKNFYSAATLETLLPLSATFSITLNDDAYSALPEEYGIVCSDMYYPADESGAVSITGLQEAVEYTFEPYAKYGEVEVKGESIVATTPVYVKPTISTPTITDVTFYSAVLYATITPGDEEILEQGFEYYDHTEWDSERGYHDHQVFTVECSGEEMTVALTDLLYRTTYRCRAYAKTESGITYGEYASFSTENYYAPSITMLSAELAAQNIFSSTAEINASLSVGSEDILEKGFEVWRTEDDVYIVLDEGDDFHSSGNSAYRGFYTLLVKLTGLTPVTTYYFRAFAKTERAEVYSDIMSFTTETEIYDLYMELNDEIDALEDYLTSYLNQYGRYSSSNYSYVSNQLFLMYSHLKDYYNNGTLDEEIAAEMWDKLAELRSMIDDMFIAQGIDNISSDGGEEAQVYTLMGTRVTTPTKGNVYIVVYSDGTRKKVLMK